LGVLHNPTCIGTDRHTGPENFPTTSIQLTLGGIYSDERLRPNISSRIWILESSHHLPNEAVACASPWPAETLATVDLPVWQRMRLYRHGRHAVTRNERHRAQWNLYRSLGVHKARKKLL